MKKKPIKAQKLPIITQTHNKSKYLQSLIKKKNEGIRIIEEEKAGLMIDKLIRANEFNRDYGFFSSQNLVPPRENIQKLHFTPNLKFIISSQAERDFPAKYRQKEYKSNAFAEIYREKSNAKNNLYHVKLAKLKNIKVEESNTKPKVFLSKIGNEIMTIKHLGSGSSMKNIKNPKAQRNEGKFNYIFDVKSNNNSQSGQNNQSYLSKFISTTNNNCNIYNNSTTSNNNISISKSTIKNNNINAKKINEFSKTLLTESN